MALFGFTKAMSKAAPRSLHHGKMKARLHYIDDIAEGRHPQRRPAFPKPLPRQARANKIYNIGNQTRGTLALHRVMETALGKTAEKISLPMQPRCPPYSRCHDLMQDVGFKPHPHA